MSDNQRLADLKAKLAASLHNGGAMPAYKERVEALRREIARLEGTNG